MTEPDPRVLRIVRRLAASPNEVFDAWLDADGIREWMCPASGTVPVAEVDARIGGRFRIVMKGDLPDDESRKRHEAWRSILERLAEKLGQR